MRAELTTRRPGVPGTLDAAAELGAELEKSFSATLEPDKSESPVDRARRLLGLPAKEADFVEEFCKNGGNELTAATKAGLPSVYGVTLLRSKRVRDAIAYVDYYVHPDVSATKLELRALYTHLARSEDIALSSRLQAAKMLGTTRDDFLTRTELTGPEGEALAVSVYLPDNGRDRSSSEDQG